MGGAVLSWLVLALCSSSAFAQTSGANGTHDPSRMIESDGRFYVYSTGGGSKSSPDGLVWTGGPAIFPGGIPQATASVTGSNQGLWAPDVIFFKGLYYLYYSIASSQSACAVGLATSPTLNPSSPNYKWTDHGPVVSNNTSATYCTIDPAPVIDATGNLWLVWGSGYSHPASSDTIFITRLDNTTGLASSSDSKYGHPLEKGHIEGAYLHYHSGYYYLFWNSGGCCDGANSSYLIHIARSSSVTGPYTGTKNFYGTTGSIHGPGHMGIYEACGVSRFTYHYYPNTGQSVLGENELTWGADGWPVVGAVSSTPIKPCGASGDGGVTGSGGAGGGPGVDAGSPPEGSGGAGGASADSGDPQPVPETGGSAGSGGSLEGSGGATGTGRSGEPTTGGPAGSGGDNSMGAAGQTMSGTGGSGQSAAPAPAADAGCSCRVQRPSAKDDSAFVWLLAAAVGVAKLRRKSTQVMRARASR